MMRCLACSALAVVLMVGCSPVAANVGSSSGTTFGTTGLVHTSVGATGTGASGTGSNSSGSSSPTSSTAAASSTASTGSTSGTASTSSGAAATNTSGSSGTTSSSCIPDGSFSGTRGAAACCSGLVDVNGYCSATGVGSSVTTTTTTNSTTTATTSATSSSGGGTTGSGYFGGGWVPPDAGYQDALTGDGGTLVLIDPTAPSNAATMFSGAVDANASPTIIYPADGVLLPPNMKALEIQFMPGAGQTVFQITFTTPGESLVVYTGCNAVGGGCGYATDTTDFWGSLVQYARGGAPVTFSISGVHGSNPGSVGVSATQSMSFSDQDLTAGVYYWNTGGAIERFDWGFPTVAPESWVSPANLGGALCVGCHALARDGDRAVVAANIPEPAGYEIFDVATTTPLEVNNTAVTGSGNFFSFAPDSSLMLQSDGVAVYLMNVNANVVNTTPVIASGTMPDWSPDGSVAVYAKPAPSPFSFSTPAAESASIQRAPFLGTAFGASTELVPFQGANNYYPAIDPTGTWVAYNVSPSNNDSFSNADPPGDGGYPDGELWVVPVAGGTPIRLSNASNPGPLSWPKWAPVVSTYAGGQLLWLTFSTQRAYGLELQEFENTQLWMVGFDPAKAAAGQDASFPAFYLPFQDSTSGNHIAQWVTSIIRPPCTENSQCPSDQICRAGRCTPNVVNKPAPRMAIGAAHLMQKPRLTGAQAHDPARQRALVNDWLSR